MTDETKVIDDIEASHNSENKPSEDIKTSDVEAEDKISDDVKPPDPLETGNKNEDDLKPSKDPSESKLDESKLRYEGDRCFYTDPSGSELEWNQEKQAWIPAFDDKQYTLEGDTYSYIDKSTGQKYKWDSQNNKWISCDIIKRVDEEDDEEEEGVENDEGAPKKKKVVRQDMSKGHYSYEGETHIYTDPNDGTVYEWDKVKSAWFPRIDDDFLANYQMNYGVSSTEEEKPVEPEKEKPEEAVLDPTLKRKPQEPTWFEVNDENNTKVYVSNLPRDITEQEFVDLMQKCGLVMKDIETGKMKVKLYTEPGTDYLKGDALCTYIKVESVQLALNVLDGYDFKGKKIKVERAKFTMKGGSYDPSLKPKKKRKKDIEKLKKIQEKLFDWRPEKMRGERSKNERIIIVKNLFDPACFDQDVGLILEFQQDLREECLKCGEVRKVTIYDKHPEGVAQVIFKEAEAADACVQLLNGRWFGKRQITAETWDGKTKFKIAETEAEINDRLKKWENFLEKEAEKEAEKEEEKQENDQTEK